MSRWSGPAIGWAALLICLAFGAAAEAQSPETLPPADAAESVSEQAGSGVTERVEGLDADSASRIEMSVEPLEATVGELVTATLAVTVASDARFEPPLLGPTLGPFSVADGTWSGPEPVDDGQRWTWSGRLSAFRTGEQEVPPVTLAVQRGDATVTMSSEPLTITIKSVLAPEELENADAELADLKPPASLTPDYGPLWAAIGVLLLLLVLSLIAWWLHRRYAAALAAAEVPSDPFHRVPPHVWVYGELQKLIERRLPEEGRVEEFYSELSRILKRYLSGRYRVDLLEQTTEELPATLRQAGAPETSIHDTQDVLGEADLVKFARETPGASQWKAGVDRVYRIVDRTKPVEVQPESAESTGPPESAGSPGSEERGVA